MTTEEKEKIIKRLAIIKRKIREAETVVQSFNIQIHINNDNTNNTANPEGDNEAHPGSGQ